MTIHANITPSRTYPKPAVFVVFNSFKEMFAHLERQYYSQVVAQCGPFPR